MNFICIFRFIFVMGDGSKTVKNKLKLFNFGGAQHMQSPKKNSNYFQRRQFGPRACTVRGSD